MMSEAVHTIVIGAGISGLATAHRLRSAHGPDSVIVLDANEEAGGYCVTDHLDGFTCDRGPNGFLDKEPRMLEWIGELGITDELLQANEASARRFLLLKDRLVEMLPPPRFFLSPVLSPLGKLRLMFEPVVPRRRAGTPESIYDFARRRIGRNAADNLVSAMVLGVFGGDATQLSLEHCFPRMHEMERDHGGLVRAMLARRGQGGGSAMGPGGTLTSFTGGIGRLTGRASQELGDSMRLNTPVTRITRSADYEVETLTGMRCKARHLVLAVPAPRAAEITAGLDDPDLRGALAGVPHASIAVVITAYPRERVGRDMDGFGFLIPPNQRKRALGCIWTSSIFEGYAPADTVCLRTLIGGTNDPDAVKLSEQELLEIVRRDIHPVMNIHSDPDFLKIYRHRTGIPQYPLNHEKNLERLARVHERNPNLRITGNAWRGVSLNECVVGGRAAADALSSPNGQGS